MKLSILQNVSVQMQTINLHGISFDEDVIPDILAIYVLQMMFQSNVLIDLNGFIWKHIWKRHNFLVH